MRIRNIFFGFVAVLFFNFSFCFADSLDNKLELLETLKTHRSEIYQNLDLTKNQEKEIDLIDKKLYKDLEPGVIQIHFYMQKIKTLAKSDFVTKEEVDEVKREFDKTDKEISLIKKKYEKNFKNILDKNQKTKYKALKKEKQKQLQEELKKDIKNQK